MGLDIALGVVVLIAAVRGWFKGFLRQAIPLGALIGCVYLADPMRDLARPHAAQAFPTIGAEVLGRLLWWASAAVAYLGVAGIGLSILKSMRKRTYGDPEPNRTDQGAGFLLGAVKGLIVASFLAAGVAKYAPAARPVAPFVEETTARSHTLAWTEAYRPAEVMWQSPPVQNWIGRVRSRGIGAAVAPDAARPADSGIAAPSASEERPVRTASKSPKALALPREPFIDPDDPEFARRLESEMRREGLDPNRP